MEFDNLKLENQLCFPLYACSKEVIKKYKPYLDEIGLTYTQYITMMVLWEHEELNVTSIGRLLYLDSGTLTPLLKKLEGAGYLERLRSPVDERNLIVRITDKGRDLRIQARDIPGKISSCIRLSGEESLQLYQLLHKILDMPAL